MLSSEGRSEISGEGPSRKGKFVYITAKEELFLLPSKQRALYAKPLGKICEFTRNGEKT